MEQALLLHSLIKMIPDTSLGRFSYSWRTFGAATIEICICCYWYPWLVERTSGSAKGNKCKIYTCSIKVTTVNTYYQCHVHFQTYTQKLKRSIINWFHFNTSDIMDLSRALQFGTEISSNWKVNSIQRCNILSNRQHTMKLFFH